MRGNTPIKKLFVYQLWFEFRLMKKNALLLQHRMSRSFETRTRLGKPFHFYLFRCTPYRGATTAVV